MKKTTGMIIICNTMEDALMIKKKLDLHAYANSSINKNHLASKWANNGIELGVWKQDYDPVVPPDYPNPVFIQGDQSTKEMIQVIKDHYAPSKKRHKESFQLLQSLFSEFEYEEFEKPLGYWARIIRKSYRAPFDLDNIDKGFEFLFNEWLEHRICQSFKVRWPFLYVYGFDDYWKLGTRKTTMIISTIHSKPRPNNEGTSTGVRLPYPLTPDDVQKMDRLNDEARKYVEEDDNFFCSGCHQTKPRAEYAAFLFHVVACKDCSTPEFEKAAREETYN